MNSELSPYNWRLYNSRMNNYHRCIRYIEQGHILSKNEDGENPDSQITPEQAKSCMLELAQANLQIRETVKKAKEQPIEEHLQNPLHHYLSLSQADYFDQVQANFFAKQHVLGEYSRTSIPRLFLLSYQSPKTISEALWQYLPEADKNVFIKARTEQVSRLYNFISRYPVIDVRWQFLTAMSRILPVDEENFLSTSRYSNWINEDLMLDYDRGYVYSMSNNNRINDLTKSLNPKIVQQDLFKKRYEYVKDTLKSLTYGFMHPDSRFT